MYLALCNLAASVDGSVQGVGVSLETPFYPAWVQLPADPRISEGRKMVASYAQPAIIRFVQVLLLLLQIQSIRA